MLAARWLLSWSMLAVASPGWSMVAVASSLLSSLMGVAPPVVVTEREITRWRAVAGG
jgi:hypothetical protein